MKEVGAYNFEAFFILFVFSIVFQMKFSLFALWVFLKSKNRAFFVSFFMVITLLPISILISSLVNFLSQDGFWGRGIEDIFGLNVIELLATNPFFYYSFFVVIASIPWIGFHFLTFYFLVREIPNSLYDMTKMDGLGWKALFFEIIFPLAGKSIPITIFASLITAFRVYEPIHIFRIVSGRDAGGAYTKWSNDLISGGIDLLHPNTRMVILTSLTFVGISFLGLFLIKVMRLKIKGR